MRRRYRAVPHVLMAIGAACGQAQVTAPKARSTASATTSPETAAPPTSAVEPETMAPSPGASAGIGSPTTVDEGRGAQSVPAPSTTILIPANSIANGPLPVAVNSGIASWYDAAPRTTASRDYPRGTRLQVCRAGACVVVTVADYGPEAWTLRSLDLSADSFAALAPLSRGVVDVTWDVVA